MQPQAAEARCSILSYFDDMPVTVIANNGGAVYLEDRNPSFFTGEFPYEKARPVMEAARSASYMHLVLIGVKDTYVQMDEPEEHKIFADFYFNKKVRFVPSLEQVIF